jgi:thiamine biosynthesis lipoprotein
MIIDLGGIAQGYAAAVALEALDHGGFPASCVDLSGDIALGDPPPGAEGWRIAIPDAGGWQTLTLSRTAVSTSGDAEQFLVIDGSRESHIIQPATGRGTTGVRSVTVIGPDPALADALATALTVLGPARGLDLARRLPNTQASIFTESESGSTTQHSTHDDP